jgi:hypothetical protein
MPFPKTDSRLDISCWLVVLGTNCFFCRRYFWWLFQHNMSIYIYIWYIYIYDIYIYIINLGILFGTEYWHDFRAGVIPLTSDNRLSLISQKWASPVAISLLSQSIDRYEPSRSVAGLIFTLAASYCSYCSSVDLICIVPNFTTMPWIAGIVSGDFP